MLCSALGGQLNDPHIHGNRCKSQEGAWDITLKERKEENGVCSVVKKCGGPEELKEGISLSQEEVCVQTGNMPASEVTENPV